ncbi:MAG: alpha/beta fold hydrolase [Candidatus Magasanikbacteria bacterium]|nr:alpha/beta fold hydrolase [Candidatus Magasanikbacteria bacterium]
MESSYDHKRIEPKWQKYWADQKLYETPRDVSPENKMYILPQLPYPSGSGLHVGHAEVYTACDIYARYQRMAGKKVLQVIGWDSFGLPAENYAIKTNVHPRESTEKAIDNFRSQIKALGVSVDWDREVGSHNPDYYKWTQWFFLLMYKRGLAYRKKQNVNWCDSCKTVLANDQVAEGHCERCGTEINQRQMEQWYLKITEYADRLLEGLERIDWPEETKKRQRDWIGRSEGAHFKMRVKGTDMVFEVYDSVPQTYTAQTFAVIAPEHAALPGLLKGTEREQEVMAFVENIKKRKREGNKFEIEQEIEGIFTGLYMDNPYGTGDLPLWVASFVIVDYGSGVVGSSAHDERDFKFAKKYDIPLRPVMFPEDKTEAEKVRNLEYCYHHDPEAVLASPKEFEGRKWGEAREEIIDFLVKQGMAERAAQYKLRDWSVSRQRFWGAPIPMVFSEERKNKKRNYILVHGYGGTGDSNFFSALKTELESEGHTVFCLTLPNTDEPRVDEQVAYILQHTKIDRDSVLLGHSLGGAVIMKLLEQTNQQVAKVVFTDAFCKPHFEDLKRKAVEESCDWNFDFEKIKSLADEFVMLVDDRYQTVSKKHSEFMRGVFDARLLVTHPKEWHFCAEFEPSVSEHARLDGFLPLSPGYLPVKLPDDVDFKPTGQSPLTYSEEFQKGVEEKYGKGWRREVDTLDTFMCSSWYYYRYLDPCNDQAFASGEQLKKWMPVDFYLGGAEHVNGHLLYARFFTKVLYDAGYIDFDEPFLKHRHQGLILGEDNRKMSKRWNNVINPTDVINEFGADTCRMYEMFMGPLEDSKPWSTNGVKGIRRFLERVWSLQDKVKQQSLGSASREIEIVLHKTIKKVGDDLSRLHFNTAIAKLMELSNEFQKVESIPPQYFETFIKLLSPFAPYMAEELWQGIGHEGSLALESWPPYDESKLFEDMITLVVQVNGKVRANIELGQDANEEDAKNKALQDPNVQKWLGEKEPKKIIYVKKKLISIVV